MHDIVDLSPRKKAEAMFRYAELMREAVELEKYLIAVAAAEKKGMGFGEVEVTYRKGRTNFESYEAAVTRVVPVEELGAFIIEHPEETKIIPAWREIKYEEAAKALKITRKSLGQADPSIKVIFKPSPA